MSEAIRDQNHVTVALGVSSADSTITLPFKIDSVTGRVLVDMASSGTVTSVSVVTANGISGTVATATTTPAITLTLGAITPTTVNGHTFTTGSSTFTGTAGQTYTFPSVTSTLMANPMTTGGDIIYGGVSGAPTRLANGTAGYVLQSNGTTLAPSWVAAGAGDVIKVGTPLNNQVGVWTGDGTIEGDAALTFDTTTDTLTSGILNATSLTASEILGTDASKNLVSLAVATYPSLTELSYVKGVTSAVQTQLNAKGVGDMVLASVQSVTGLKTFDTTKLAVKGSSTGSTAVASANAGASDYTQTLQSKTGTIANSDDTFYIGTTQVALNRSSAALTLAGITLTTPDIGTPSAGVLTNATGLPIAGLVASTSTALGVGSIELGHATDTSITRVSAGLVAIEGANIMTVSSADTVTGVKTLGTTGAIKLGSAITDKCEIRLNDSALNDETWSGTVLDAVAGATLAVGDVCYLKTADGQWYLNDGILDGTDAGFKLKLGICVLAANDNEATKMLLDGLIASAAFPTFTVGAPVYLDDTAGDLTVTQPSTTNFAIRVVGEAVSATVLHFHPSNDYIVHV